MILRRRSVVLALIGATATGAVVLGTIRSREEMGPRWAARTGTTRWD